jgi:predicted ATPase/DNA-binding SARP family transcriptional activator
VLGPLEVSHDQQVLPIGGPKQRTVLAVLLAHAGRVISADRLIDAVWGETAPPSARRTLQSFVSNLRRLVNDDQERLTSRGAGYVIEAGPVELDSLRFEAQVAAGLSELDVDPTRAATRLRRALEMWRGMPYAGLTHEVPSLAHDAVRLEETRMAAVEGLTEARLRLGEHRLLVPDLQELVREYPFRERLLGQLMVALHRSGRSTEALRAYREGRRIFGEELGTEPGKALQNLEQGILLHDERLELATISEPPSWPRYVTSLVGRRQQIEELTAMIERQRLVTMVGPPGVGKTRLAAETLARLDGPERVYWVDLVGIDAGAGRVVGRMANALAIPETIGTPPRQLILARLRERDSLVVLDNCEHLLDEAAELSALILRNVETARLLATSREPMRLDGEHVFRVPPLAVPQRQSSDWDALLEYESIALLAARADAATGGSLRSEAGGGAAADIVTRLDGLPLAIELAAGKLRSVSLQELNQRLEDRFRILVDGDPTARPTHRSLEAALQSSHASLSSDERDLLHCLAVFQSSFDAEAAHAVATSTDLDAARVAPALTRLVDQSLVVAEVETITRYRLLESVRQFALDRADPARLEAAFRRHRDHFLARAGQVRTEMVGPSIGAWLQRARADHDNYLAAVRWSLDRGSGDGALGICASLAPFWYRISYLTSGRALLDEALQKADAGSQWFVPGITARAWLAYAAGAPDAVVLARDAVESADARGLLTDRAATRGALAGALIAAGNAESGLEAATSCLALATETGEVEAIAIAEQMTGLALLGLGDLTGAAEYLTSARDRMRAYRVDVDAGWILVQLGEARLALGDVDSAIEAAESAVRDFSEREDPKGLAAACVLLGRASVDRDPPRARALLEEGAAVSERWGYESQSRDARAALAALSSNGAPGR